MDLNKRIKNKILKRNSAKAANEGMLIQAIEIFKKSKYQ